MIGHVVRAVSEKSYLVRFDNVKEKELPSAVLNVESITASIPLDILVPVAETIREEALLENELAVAEQDAVDKEHMPDAGPEQEEQEVDEEANDGQEQEEEV
jgi:hypothetical protein